MEKKKANLTKNDEKSEKKMVLSRLEKFGYGVGHVQNDLCAAIWFTYSLIYYSKVVNLSNDYAGVIMLIGQVADAVATPIIGIISDRVSIFGSVGKRKSWYLLGTILVTLSMPFLYSPCFFFTHSEDTVKLVYYSVFVVIFQFGWAAVQIAHLAMVPDLTNDDMERTDLLSLRNSFTILSNLATYSVTFVVLAASHNADDSDVISERDTLKFQIIDYVICGVGLVASMIFFFTVKETEPETPLLENEIDRRPVRLSFKELFSNAKLYQVGLVYTATRLFCNISQTLIALYLDDDLHLNKTSYAVVPFIMYVSSFLASWITRPINELLGRKLAFTLGSAIGLAGCVWIWFGHGDFYKTYCIYAVAVLIGAAYSIQLVTSLAITADLIGNDNGNGAFIYGLMSFADKLSNGAAIMAVQSMAPKMSTLFYTDALAYVCGGSSIAGFFSVITIHTVPRRVLEQENSAVEAVEEG